MSRAACRVKRSHDLSRRAVLDMISQLTQRDEDVRDEPSHAAKTESRPRVRLATFDNSWYAPGGRWKRAAWYFCNLIFVDTALPFPSSFRARLLRLFGAKVGRGLVIKPRVNIKFPWLLEIGDDVWIGEGAWIDNLARVTIGSDVCISQGAYILTGNHDYKSTAFDLVVKPVTIEDGAWVGAKATVCPGVRLATHAIVTVGSVLAKDGEPYTIYAGNPAQAVRRREIVRSPKSSTQVL